MATNNLQDPGGVGLHGIYGDGNLSRGPVQPSATHCQPDVLDNLHHINRRCHYPSRLDIDYN
jgi:hypothetical protein